MYDRPAFLVTGKEIPNEEGADGEPLLEPGTIKILRKLSYDEIVDSQDYWLTFSGKELEDKETPKIPTTPETLDKQEIKSLRKENISLAKEILKEFPDTNISIAINKRFKKKYFVLNEPKPHNERKKMYSFCESRNMFFIESYEKYSQIHMKDLQIIFNINRTISL